MESPSVSEALTEPTFLAAYSMVNEALPLEKIGDLFGFTVISRSCVI